MNSKNALRIILGIAFVMIMLVSVNHIAWAVHSMDSKDNSWWAWFMSYMFAIAIDAAIASISVFLTTKKGFGYKIVGYGFVVGLTGLSWFANWTFNIQHMDITGVWAGSMHIWFLGMREIKLRWFSPIAFGSLPLLGIVFSIMIDFFTGEQTTAAELETAMLEKQAITEIKKKYANINDGLFSDAIKRKIDEVKDVASYAKKTAVEVLEKAPVQVHDDELQNLPVASSMQTAIEPEMKPIVNTPVLEETDMIAPAMGGIESMMYNMFVANMPALSDVILLSQSVSLAELTAHLQSRFSRHASFITEARVQVVMEEIQRNHPEQFQFAEDETGFETESETEVGGDDVSYMDADVDTGERESVSPKPRITAKLNTTGVKPERNTDDLTPVSRKSTTSGSKSATSGETEKSKKIRRLVKQNPDITPVEIATKLKTQGLNVSSQYAGRVKKQVQAKVTA